MEEHEQPIKYNRTGFKSCVYHLQGKALDKLDSPPSICYGDVEMIIDNVYEIVTAMSNKGSHNYYYYTVSDTC